MLLRWQQLVYEDAAGGKVNVGRRGRSVASKELSLIILLKMSGDRRNDNSTLLTVSGGNCIDCHRIALDMRC